MQITLELPDEIGLQLGEGRDLSRMALEALVAESCRDRRLSNQQAAQVLGIGCDELDSILRVRGADFDREFEDEIGRAWGRGISREWSAELSDPRLDIYSLEDGQPVNAAG
jgi:hypothetical protein